MHLARLGLLGFALGLLLAGCAKSSGGQTGDEDALPSDDLFGELGKRGGSGDYQPYGLAGLVDRSHRVVVGHAVALRQGRTYVEEDRAQPGGEVRLYTVVLEIAVERTLKGPENDSLYLEFIIGAEDSAPPREVPDTRLIAFAVPETDRTGGIITIEGAGRGLPADDQLYALTTPQGLAVAEAGGFSQPLEPSDTALGDGDLDDLIARIEATLMPMGSDAGQGDRDAGATAGGGGAGGSAAGSSAPTPDAGGCRGEVPSGPGLDPVPCPPECSSLRGSPFDETNMCIDYMNQTLLGCTEGVGPPIVVCIERIADGQRFQVGAGWPFPGSTSYRTCSDDVTSTVLSAPSCP